MGLAELLLTGIGLAMDAFAVSIAKGLGMRSVNYRHAFVIALLFGGFQALMPCIGWALGSQFASVVTPVDHWVAFALLAFIGGKMLWDALRGGDGEESPGDANDEERLDIGQLVVMAVATSIDALAVGITFAFLQVNIVFAVSCIGLVTFVLCFAGVVVGNQFGARWEKPSQVAGGVVLVLIGLRILLDHLGVIAF